MKFCLQDTGFSENVLLHEELSKAFGEALYGGGTYAFVTESGIHILIGGDNFSDFMETGKFELIVGTDDITGIKELNKLTEFVEKFTVEKFDVKAFYNTKSRSTFHPKFSWFKNKTGGKLIVGSGNLTLQGLRKNTEAFTVTELNDQEIMEIERQWRTWTSENSQNIRSIDDKDVINKLENNAKKSKEFRKLKFKLECDNKEASDTQAEIICLDANEADNLDTWSFSLENNCLVAEIPKNGDRLKQVNFNKESFESFFGAVAGNNDYRILLRNVNDDGKLEEIENRPSVSVASQNYRFELNAVAGYSYPESGKPPIAVFIKVETRTFIYEFLMPDNHNYAKVVAYLNSKEPHGRNLRRITDQVNNLIVDCPDLSLWNYLMKIEEV